MSDPARVPIELLEHDPAWRVVATRETERLRGAIGDALIDVHHIGSTSIPGIRAKPIVDLLPVVRTLDAIDAARPRVEALGWRWRGEFGIPGRRYCVLADAATGRRIAHAHVFAAGSDEIARHVGFRDYLRAHPGEARAYEAEKLRVRALHPDDLPGYTDAKGAWIQACDRRAAAWRARQV